MIARRPKVHLLLRGSRAGCGINHPRLHTRQMDLVTCIPCQKSIQMHDLQILHAQQPH